MFPKKPRHLLYAFLLLIFFAMGTTAIANTKVLTIFSEVTAILRDIAAVEKTDTSIADVEDRKAVFAKSNISSEASAPMFMTPIQGADDVVVCSADGRSIARFILCGDSDDRTISLSGGPYSSVSWEVLDGAAPNTNAECPNTTPSNYTQVSTNPTFALNAGSVPTSTGAEYRVVADGQVFYMEVIKSTIDYDVLKKDFVCNNPGRIEITGLPNSYQFRLRQGSEFGPYGSSSIFQNLDAGTYQVQARLNVSGSVCEYLLDPIVIEDIDISIEVTFTNPVCSGENGMITAMVDPAVPGPYIYTLLDESGAEVEFTSTISSPSYTFAAVSEGIYGVQVETNDCKEDIPNGISAPVQYNDTSGNVIEVGTGLDPITAVTDTNGMSFGCSDITFIDIDVTPSGGSGNYRYTVSDGGDSGAGFFSGTSSYRVFGEGTYTFFIEDDQGCTAEKSEYVAELSPPDIDVNSILGTCSNGGGKVEFVVNNARGFNLEYRVTNNTGDAFISSSTIPLADNTYNTVEVRYSQGSFTCVSVFPAITVTSDGGLSGNAELFQDYTCTNGEGIIRFDAEGSPNGAAGGSGTGYEYSIDNITYQTGLEFTGLVPGTTYTPWIKDDAGCFEALTPITVAEPVPPTNVIFVQDDLDCLNGTSRVTITVEPAAFPVSQYAVVGSNPATTLPPSQASNVFTGLRLDTSYQFEIIDTDGCAYPASFTTGGISSIRARVKSGGDRRVCPGVADGNGAFLIDGFGSDYDYEITGPAAAAGFPMTGTAVNNSEVAISGLGVGTYQIRVTDNVTNCVSNVSFDIEEAVTPLSVTNNVTPMSCQNNNVGRVQANGTGGFPGYRYRLQWPASSGVSPQGPSTGRTFGNLTAEGEYILTIIDIEGCEAETRFTLTTVTPPTISFDSADYCYSPSNDGEIVVSSAVGSASPSSAPLSSHQYRINGGALQTPATDGTFTFDNLVPGNYTIEVVDGNGCSAQTSVIRIPPQIQVDLAISSEIPCGGDGEMEITVTGGDISPLTGTSYTIEFRDAAPNAFAPVASHNGIVLPSDNFNYTVPLGSHGDYRVVVEDNNGCTNISEPITFIEPTNIAATERVEGPSCGDANSGFVEVIPTVSSGIPPFEVVFAPAGELQSNPLDPNNPGGPDPINYSFSSRTVYSGLAAGNYEYVVRDARNCVTAVTPVNVVTSSIGAPDATLTPIDATCSAGPLSGGVVVDLVSAGSPDYTVIIEDNFGNPLVTRNNVAPGDFALTIEDPSLEPGDYQVIVLDSRGCSDIESLTINSAELDIIPLPAPTPTCDPAGTTLCVDITGGTAPLDYEIRLADPDPNIGWVTPNNPPDGHCFAGLLNGASYIVEVRDVNTGCTYEEVVTLPDGPGPTIALDIDNATCRDGNVGLNYTISPAAVAPFEVVITNLDSSAVVYGPVTSSDTTLATDLVVPAGRYGISLRDAGNCSAGDEGESSLNLPRVDIIDNQNANCNELGQLTVRGSGGTPFATGSPYFYAYVPAGTTPSAADFTEDVTVSLAGSLAPGTEYDIWVRDANGCDYRISAAIIQLNPDLPNLDPVVNNQCDVTATAASGFDITLSLPGDYDTPTFTLNGVSQTVANSGNPAINTTATFTVNSVGSYPYNIIDANGCDIDGIAEVYQVLSASGNFITEPTCEDNDGAIRINTDGGSGNFSYFLTGTDFAGNPVSDSILDDGDDTITNFSVEFINLSPGNYEVLIEDQIVDDGTNQCTTRVENIIRSAPITPVIDDTGETDISCNGLDDGSIAASIVAGSDADGIAAYNLYVASSLPVASGTTPFRSNNSGSFSNLPPNDYVVEVVTDRGCLDQELVNIAEPPVFSIDAVAGTLACEVGADRFSTTTITATVNDIGNGAPYGFKLDIADSYETTNLNTFDFEIVDNGMQQTFNVYAIDSNGCEFVSPDIVIDPPTDVTATITQVRALDCELPERIRIDVVGTTDFIIEDRGFSAANVADQTPNSGDTFVEFDLPTVQGDYYFQVNDIAGCTYPLMVYTVEEFVLPIVRISQNKSVGCLFDASGAMVSTDGNLNIEITNLGDLTGFSEIYDYWVYEADDPGFTSGTFSGPVAGNSTGTITIASDMNPAVITGLPGGNLRVVVRESNKTVTACEVYSNVATIETPSEQLRFTDLDEIGRVGCSNDLGEILATTAGGYDGSPYEYMLEYENPVGSGFSPHSNATYADFATNGNNNRFTGLSSGNYRVSVRDIADCIHSEEILLQPVDPVQADAIITRELECPTGNDAIIVAVEPGTTTPGAIGGVPGGGYQYRLINIDTTNLDPDNPGALDLTDPANINSTTGQQNEPEFEGASGTGVISGGWYAIEIVSTLNCRSFTTPIQVIPPPPIAPALVQTSVPACGNIATMLIRVNNPQGGTYEYRRIYPDTSPSFVAPGDPSIVWLPVDETDADGLPVKRDIPGTVNESYRYEVRRNGSSTSCLARKTRGITITEAEPLVLEPTSPTFDVSCAFQVDGRIEAIATGGTGIYEFRIYDSNPGTDAFVALPLATYQNRAMQTFGTFENLDAGEYYISVISRQNCGVVQGPFTIAPAEPVIVESSATPTTCFGENDGSITMNVTSATAGLVKFAIEPNLSEFLTDPDNPLTYTFSDLEPRPFGAGPGYTVLAQDAEGCPQFFEIFVETPNELIVADVATSPETCLEAADGMAQLTITGGTPIIDPATSEEYFRTKLVGPGSDGTEVFLRNDNLSFDNLPGGTSYIVFIQDANLCETFVEVPIEIGVDLTAEPIVEYGCEGIFPNSTARVELEDTSRISEILFALDPIDSSDAVTALATTERQWGDLAPGDHIVYIYHENGCTTNVEFTIDAYEPLTLSAEKTGPNELTAIASGGFGGYEYFFNGESFGSERIYTTTESGVVEVRVLDQNGCVAVISIPFEFTGMLELPNFFTPNGDNENDFWSPKNREFFPDIEVIIYDRYGRVVAELDQVSEWDGLYDNKELPSGDYWYVVNQNDKRSTRYVGHFTLYR